MLYVLHWFCLATTGVCVFYALASVGAFFVFCTKSIRRMLMTKKLKNKWLVGLACTACLFGACGFAAQGTVVANAETSGGGDSSTSLHSAQNDIGEGESGQSGSDNPSVTQGVTGLRQSKVDFAFGHRVDGRYVHAHLVPKKHY